MEKADFIHHTGTIKKIFKDRILVNLEKHSACGECHARGVCSVSEVEKKVVEIFDASSDYNIGEEVNVIMKKSLGFKALFIGYIIPFLILVLTLFLSLAITKNEGLSGLFAIAILAPYYIGLYFLKGKISNTFIFEIGKMK